MDVKFSSYVFLNISTDMYINLSHHKLLHSFLLIHNVYCHQKHWTYWDPNPERPVGISSLVLTKKIHLLDDHIDIGAFFVTLILLKPNAFKQIVTLSTNVSVGIYIIF